MKTNFILEGRKIGIEIEPEEHVIWFKFKYNQKLLNEVKTSFEGRRWNPDKKQWSVKNTQHNWFQIRFLMGLNPYEVYDCDLPAYESIERELRFHQQEFTSHVLFRKQCIIAGEMGLGKTLSIIEAMERSGVTNWLYVAPRSALYSVSLELKKWKAKVQPELVTYHQLTKIVETWEPGVPVYQGIVFDESSRLKNPVAKRTKAAKYLADSVRDEWDNEGYVVLMSGSPAPKSPLDWYSQCSIARPGYLKEGHIASFKDRLAIMEKRDNPTGGSYGHIVSWLDNEDKCGKCGQFSDHAYHDPEYMLEGDPYHAYRPSKNEVANLYNRMKGLVLVRFKKDCLDLPEKQYHVIRCEVSESMKRLAQIVTRNSPKAATALVKLRQLSDGFQYTESKTGTETCPICHGNRTIIDYAYVGPEQTETESYDDFCYRIEIDPNKPLDQVNFPNFYKKQDIACPNCNGTGIKDTFNRVAEELECPKFKILEDLLDQHDELGRIVIYAGFTGSIDKCVQIAKKEGWNFIRMDGRGWFSDIPGGGEDLLNAFQNEQDKYPKLAFIGQPGAAGMGITLTASQSIVYYSNDFNAESRIQSEDRIHRLGTKAANIFDIIHLPTDEFVLDNLKKKRDLQSMSLGDLEAILCQTST